MSRLVKILVETLGFGDGNGKVSFNKLVTFTSLYIFAGTVYLSAVHLRQLPPWYVWTFGTLIVYAGFGFKGLALFKQREERIAQTETVTVATNVADVIKALKAPAPRDVKAGFQDSSRVPQVHQDGPV